MTPKHVGYIIAKCEVGLEGKNAKKTQNEMCSKQRDYLTTVYY